MQRIIFWQNIISILQSALIRNIAAHPEYEVTLVVEKEITQHRLRMGWSNPDFGNAKLEIAPDEETIEQLIFREPYRTVHIFSGIRAYPMVWSAFKRCLSSQAKIGVLSESANWLGIKGKLRLFWSLMDAIRFRRRIDFILAIGHLGVRWFNISGYPQEKIYPFGYFVEKPISLEAEIEDFPCSGRERVRLCFIGQFIRRKALNLALKALGALKNLDWSFLVIGDGREKPDLETLSNALGLTGRVSFLGTLRNEEVMCILARCDLLILPSRWDGWGAVVSEALMRGVPVLCTNYCGAANLVSSPERGSVVKAESIESLKSAMKSWIRKGAIKKEMRTRIRKWSQCIEGDTAADYLLKIINHVKTGGPRPRAPWLS